MKFIKAWFLSVSGICIFAFTIWLLLTPAMNEPIEWQVALFTVVGGWALIGSGLVLLIMGIAKGIKLK